MTAKKKQNYLDLIPARNPDIVYETDTEGIVTVRMEWKGFFHFIAQRFFRRPKTSSIRLDEYGSFVWLSIDGQKDVHRLSGELAVRFPDMENPLARLIRFLEILRDSHLILWNRG